MKIKKIAILSFFLILSTVMFAEISEEDMKIYSKKYDAEK